MSAAIAAIGRKVLEPVLKLYEMIRSWPGALRAVLQRLTGRSPAAPAGPSASDSVTWPALPMPTRSPMSPPPRATIAMAPPGVLGFDCDVALTDTASAFVAQGFRFVVRSMSRGTSQAAGDLSAGEVAAILGAGLALMAVQHVEASGWVPSEQLGANDGDTVAANAIAIGLPRGISLWLDLEGVAKAGAAGIVAHCNAWFAAVQRYGFRPGVHVGANSGLTADQLGYDVKCHYFWQSGSDAPAFSGFGYCMVQNVGDSFNIAGVAYDRNVIQANNYGMTPYWAVAGAPEISP